MAPPEPVKLLSVIPGPAFGGAHNQAMALKAPLELRGIETLVVLPEEAEAAAARLEDGGIEVVLVPMQRLRASGDPRVHLRLLGNLRKDHARLSSLIASRAIDVVQVHGATNPQGAIAARRQGRAVVWQLFDTRAPMALRRVAMPLVIRLADAMTVWGRELVRAHPGAERLGERVTVVYPPVDLARFAASSALREHSRAQLGVPAEAPLIGSVGVLNPQKGHEYLIRSAKLVRERVENVQFRILGVESPAHTAYLRSLHEEIEASGLSDCVQLVDPRDQVPELMQAFDVFAMASVPRSEGMPTVILEAMASGKPVVATDVGAVAELVEAGVSGIVTQPLQPDLMAQEIVELLCDDERRNRIAHAGLVRAQREFSLDRLADLHAEAYRQAIAHRRETLGASGRPPHPV